MMAALDSIRVAFAARFSEETAFKVETASLLHSQAEANIVDELFKNAGHRSDDWGSDPFRYHLLNCIGHECFEVGVYRSYHGFDDIQESFSDIHAWVVGYARLDLFDGDHPDRLSLALGVYDGWMP